jgi:hypothetical protein
VAITLRPLLGAAMRLKLDYPACPPGATPSASHSMRLWTLNASHARTASPFPAGHYLAPRIYTGTELLALGFSTTNTVHFGIEGVFPATNQTISISVDPDGPGLADYVHTDQVNVTIIRTEFIDDIPDYALGEDEDTPSNTSDNDSDNFFLRQHDGTSGDPDYKDIDIYYRIMPAGIDVSDVKINVYEEDTATKVMFGSEDHLDGETDASGDFKTGDNLHVKWPDVRDASGYFRDVGFYRLELEVYVASSSPPICKTPIDDADTSTPGWQCPQDGLGIHDLAYKHRPEIYVGANEDVAPNGPCFPFDSSFATTRYRLRDFTDTDNPAWAAEPNYSEWTEFPTWGGDPQDSSYVYPVLSASAAKANTADHCIDMLGQGEGGLAGQEPLVQGATIDCAVGHHGTKTANHIFIQFWTYETASYAPYGSPGWPVGAFVHDADWEMVQACVQQKDVGDPSNKAKWLLPWAATASQHYYGQTLAWRLDKEGATGGTVAGLDRVNQRYVLHAATSPYRFRVFVGENSHATYFQDGDIDAAVIGADSECGTQVQYDNSHQGVYDSTATPDRSDLAVLYPLNVGSGSAMYDWQGLWNGHHDAGLGIRSPVFRQTHAASGNFAMASDPKQFHNLCRKHVNASGDFDAGGTDDAETALNE